MCKPTWTRQETRRTQRALSALSVFSLRQAAWITSKPYPCAIFSSMYGHSSLSACHPERQDRPVAIVLAEDLYTALDARDMVEVDYEPMQAVTDPEQAVNAGAPLLYEEFRSE